MFNEIVSKQLEFESYVVRCLDNPSENGIEILKNIDLNPKISTENSHL